MGDYWNTVLPTAEDLDLQVNTIAHTEMVINLGSSMVFDYISYDKPCVHQLRRVRFNTTGWSVEKIYRFVHFRSMPSRESVLWIDSPQSIVAVIRKGLNDSGQTVREAKRWFERINQHPPQDASSRIWQTMDRSSTTKLPQQKNRPMDNRIAILSTVVNFELYAKSSKHSHKGFANMSSTDAMACTPWTACDTCSRS
jgi:hypothetical protein